MGERIRTFNWSKHPLGPLARWPQSLKTAVRIMLASRQPIWIGWGPDLNYLYNDPYKTIIGGKHPDALGQPTAVVWREIWHEIGPMLATAMTGHIGTYVEEQRIRSAPLPSEVRRSLRGCERLDRMNCDSSRHGSH
jgi:hypothetical protein